jgi:hypothetical protein
MSAANLALTGTRHHDSVPPTPAHGGIPGPMPPVIAIIRDLSAAIALVRHCDREGTLILVNAAVPDRRLRNLTRVLLTAEEREALTEYLTD